MTYRGGKKISAWSEWVEDLADDFDLGQTMPTIVVVLPGDSPFVVSNIARWGGVRGELAGPGLFVYEFPYHTETLVDLVREWHGYHRLRECDMEDT